MEKVIIKGEGKYANRVLTIGNYCHCGGKVTTSEWARLREECDKYYEFEILKRRVLK